MTDSSNSTGYLLQQVATALTRHSDQVLQDRLNISYSQLKIMLVLQESSGLRQKDIASSLGQTEASVSRQLKLMSDERLVKIALNSNNKREHIVVVTKKGDRLTSKAMIILNNYHLPMFRQLSQEQALSLQDSLKLMHEFLLNR